MWHCFTTVPHLIVVLFSINRICYSICAVKISKNKLKKIVEEFFYFKKSYMGNSLEVKKMKKTIPDEKIYTKNLDIKKIDSIFAL